MSLKRMMKKEDIPDRLDAPLLTSADDRCGDIDRLVEPIIAKLTGKTK